MEYLLAADDAVAAAANTRYQVSSNGGVAFLFFACLYFMFSIVCRVPGTLCILPLHSQAITL